MARHQFVYSWPLPLRFCEGLRVVAARPFNDHFGGIPTARVGALVTVTGCAWQFAHRLTASLRWLVYSMCYTAFVSSAKLMQPVNVYIRFGTRKDDWNMWPHGHLLNVENYTPKDAASTAHSCMRLRMLVAEQQS